MNPEPDNHNIASPYHGDGFTLHLGDCLQTLRGMPDNSVDAVVTDPPYGLGKQPDALAMLTDWIMAGHHEVKGRGFMGKEWDAFVPQPVLWAEVYRVLKPGGHVVAFAGTRTQDLMALGLRLAGFEIRDLLAWVYGSGFPKSLDVSKAIDKRGGAADLIPQIGAAIRAARESRGMSAAECDAIFCGGSTNWSWFEGRPKGQRAPTSGTFALIVQAWPELAPMADAVAEVEREVIGQKNSCDPASWYAGRERGDGVVNITAPATDAARAWQGWGTALKPALEPITLARKPLDGTVAETVLRWRTGALNVDGCRVGDEGGTRKGGDQKFGWDGSGTGAKVGVQSIDAGRWPANLIHDGSPEVLAGFPQEGGASAARFFYNAKAQRDDRDEGLDGFEQQRTGAMQGNLIDGGRTRSDGTPIKTPVRANIHPTVKPTDLMRWLCRLITPPGGVILDPFMGSGSTGKAALIEGFQFVGCELDPDFFAIARARIEARSWRALLTRAEPGSADNDNATGNLFAWGGV